MGKNIVWTNITSVKKGETKKPEFVYDVELEANHYFAGNGIVTHNCRLQIDTDVLRIIGGGLFGSSTGNTGAVAVQDINMNRFGLESIIRTKSDDITDRVEYIKSRMKCVMQVLMDAHNSKRKWLENNKDLYPVFFSYNTSLRSYFSVFGCIGMHEMLENLGFSGGIINEDGKKIAHDIMQYMHSIINEYIIKYKVACGIEASPGENACVKLARLDKTYCRKNGITRPYVQGIGQDVWLSSGCDVPQSADQPDKILNAAEFQCYFTSGSVLHNHITDSPSVNTIANFMDRIFNQSINYATYSPVKCTCMECGNNIFSQDIANCPECGSDDITIISRVIGYAKQVARKNLKFENGKLEGDHNFWSSPRRRDFSERTKLTSKDMI